MEGGQAPSAPSEPGEAAALLELARSRLADGFGDAAAAAARRALRALRAAQGGHPPREAEALSLLAAAQLGKGYWELALRAAREARQLLDRHGLDEAAVRRELETTIARAHHGRGEEPPSSATRSEALAALGELAGALERRDAAAFADAWRRAEGLGAHSETDVQRAVASELERDPEGAGAFLAEHLPQALALTGTDAQERAQDVCCLRTFAVESAMQSGTSRGADWTQSRWQITLRYQLQGGPRAELPGGWSRQDVAVEASQKYLKVTLGGQPLRDVSGDLLEDIWCKDSWWAIEEGLLVIHMHKRVGRAWKDVWFFPNSGTLRREQYPWNDRLRFHGDNHTGPLFGYAPPDDVPDESMLEALTCGRPELEEDEPVEGGGYARSVPGGPFAPYSDRYICSAEDLCVGLTAEQDRWHVTIQVHFQRVVFESLKQRYALERLVAADVWPGAVCLFIQGDKRNPILWGELGGQCVPYMTTWRITSSEAMRHRQDTLGGHSPALMIRLRKAPNWGGHWPSIFGECVQAKLMRNSKGEEGDARFEGLPGLPVARRAGYDLESPDFWSFVDDYARESLKKTGCASGPRKLQLAA